MPNDLDLGTSVRETGFFRVQQVDGRWWFIDPEGKEFFSLALNHAEETDLKYPENYHVWASRYGNRERWIREGALSDLKRFGFNTLGWTEQWVAGDYKENVWTEPVDLLHSPGWSLAELQSAGMPFVHVLHFARFEEWNAHPVFPDVFSREFEDYCDFVARSACDALKDDPNLLGYFYQDVPAWRVHSKSGTFFDAADGSEEQLFRIASTYYAKTAAAIKRYDPHHLILGDRYNGNRGIPLVVLEAARPHVDVMSIQWFPEREEQGPERMRRAYEQWHEATGLPILNPDAGNSTATAGHAARPDSLPDQAARGEHYRRSLLAVAAEPWFVGWHWCGYVENAVRGYGIKSPTDEPYRELTDVIAGTNQSVPSLRFNGGRSAY